MQQATSLHAARWIRACVPLNTFVLFYALTHADSVDRAAAVGRFYTWARCAHAYTGRYTSAGCTNTYTGHDARAGCANTYTGCHTRTGCANAHTGPDTRAGRTNTYAGSHAHARSTHARRGTPDGARNTVGCGWRADVSLRRCHEAHFKGRGEVSIRDPS